VRKTLRGRGSDLALEAFASELLRIYSAITHKKPTRTYSDYDKSLSGMCLKFVQRGVTAVGAEISDDQIDRLIRLGRRARNNRN
jgi:hypothetical protein